MIKSRLKIENIPAILWGKKSDKLFVAVHGNMSNKEDDAIAIFAEEAIAIGYQVLSFDLPEHGDCKNEAYVCKVQNCVKDLNTIINYAQSLSNNISVFACSIGAYLTNASTYFHEHLGYRKVEHFTKCGYKFENWYDMIWMGKIIGEHSANPKPVIPI